LSTGYYGDVTQREVRESKKIIVKDNTVTRMCIFHPFVQKVNLK